MASAASARLLIMIAAANVLAAAAVSVTGGYHFQPFGLRVSSHNPLHHLAGAGLALALAFVFDRDLTTRRLAAVHQWLERRAASIALAIAMVIVAVGWFEGTHCACGSDAHGYVAQAELWSRGTARMTQPSLGEVPWPEVEWTFAPIGFRPATVPGQVVPIYPAGLPLWMAAARRIGGPEGPYAVVPLLAGLALWLTFALGRHVAGPVAGLVAAALLAASPIFLFQSMQPMSDIPGTAWSLLAVTLILRGQRATDVLAGLASGMALLTRPNLIVLAPIIGAFAFWAGRQDHEWKHGALRALSYAAGVLPGLVALAWINHALYGSALESGYGDVKGLYSSAFVAVNARRFSSWLMQLETPFILFALGAPLLRLGTRRVVLLFALAAIVVVSFLAYKPYDNWPFARLLLPAIVLLLVLAAASFVVLISTRLPRPAMLVVLVTWVALPIVQVHRARQIGVFEATASEERATIAARYIDEHLPARAVIVSLQHSGSVRHYTGRLTLRWDWLDPGWLDRAIAVLGEKGYSPYILLDNWEEPQFRRRFAGQRHGALDWTPRLEIRHSIPVRLYDPADRPYP